MQHLRKRWRKPFAVVAVCLAFGAATGFVQPPEANACPMCKVANESKEDNRLPRAYMYSILFMISMPATLLAGFGLTFYRITSKHQQSLEMTDSFDFPERSGDV